MYPNQPAPPAPNPYDFIYNQPGAPKKSIIPSGSMKARIILVVIILVVVMIGFIVATSLLGSAGKAQTQRYIEIAQRETEIIRLATLAERDAKSLETKSLAVTVKFAFTTAQDNSRSVLNSRGVSDKSLSSSLTASKNTKSDETLDDAKKNNRYDETFTQLITAEMQNYQKLIKASANGATQKDLKTLQISYDQATTILGPISTTND